ncbi:MAG: hypothetical protein ABI643_04105 [Candidatus Doudnabacteria bacterium]
MISGSYRKAVLPGNPVFDKIAALCVLIEYITGQLAWPNELTLEYWRSNDNPGADTKKRWETEGSFVIDVGEKKYHSRGIGSAVTGAIEDLGINLDNREDLKWLMDVADRNNKTGYLKGYSAKHNMPYLIRELYKPGSFVNGNTAVEAGAHVIFTALRYRQMKKVGSYPRSTDDLAKTSLPYVPASDEPFTLGSYKKQMFCLGESLPEIEARLKFWLDAKSRADKADARAAKTADEKATIVAFGDGKNLATIRTDDDRLARALFTGNRPPDIVIGQPRNGCVQILSNRKHQGNPRFMKSVEKLTELLQKVDKASWFFDSRIGAVMNGTRSLKESVPTILTIEAIIDMIASTVEF